MTPPAGPFTVTRDDVEALWAAAIAEPHRHDAIAAQAEEFFGHAENPIVDDGLHVLHGLGRTDADHGASALRERRDRWRRRLAAFDVDPDGWMRAHLRGMIADHAARHGRRAARRFGATMVRQGLLFPDDVDRAVPHR